MSEEFEQKKNPITMTRLLLENSKRHNSTGDFPMLLQSIQLAIKVIASATSKAGISNLYGVNGTANTSGDVQKKLDILANDVFVNSLQFSDQVYIMGSEEEEEPYIVQNTKGGYAVVFDPLDGSSNIDANVAIGTIFGIYKKESNNDFQPTTVSDLLQPGTKLVAAGYSVYGPATMLVLATQDGVNVYTHDPTIGEFILTQANIQIPLNGTIYSINEGNALKWDIATTKYINNCKEKSFRARYIGSMVADVHRTLVYGGIFAYPKDISNPNGKLRLLYECNPMSFIIEKAGGKATTGNQRVLEIIPTTLHQRSAIWLGSANMITEVEELYKQYPN